MSALFNHSESCQLADGHFPIGEASYGVFEYTQKGEGIASRKVIHRMTLAEWQ